MVISIKIGGMNGDPSIQRERQRAPNDPLAAGDTAAEFSWWPEAVSAWQRALATPRRQDAIERLAWFVASRSGRQSSLVEVLPSATAAFPTVFLSFACGLLGTAAVFVAESLDGTLRLITVIIAWGLYATSAVLSLVYAQRTQRRRGPRTVLDNEETVRLCADATALARGHVSIESVASNRQSLESEGSNS